MKASKHVGKQTCRQANMQASSQANFQAGRQIDRQAGRQASRQAAGMLYLGGVNQHCLDLEHSWHRRVRLRLHLRALLGEGSS